MSKNKTKRFACHGSRSAGLKGKYDVWLPQDVLTATSLAASFLQHSKTAEKHLTIKGRNGCTIHSLLITRGSILINHKWVHREHKNFNDKKAHLFLLTKISALSPKRQLTISVKYLVLKSLCSLLRPLHGIFAPLLLFAYRQSLYR